MALLCFDLPRPAVAPEKWAPRAVGGMCRGGVTSMPALPCHTGRRLGQDSGHRRLRVSGWSWRVKVPAHRNVATSSHWRLGRTITHERSSNTAYEAIFLCRTIQESFPSCCAAFVPVCTNLTPVCTNLTPSCALTLKEGGHCKETTREQRHTDTLLTAGAPPPAGGQLQRDPRPPRRIRRGAEEGYPDLLRPTPPPLRGRLSNLTPSCALT